MMFGLFIFWFYILAQMESVGLVTIALPGKPGDATSNECWVSLHPRSETSYWLVMSAGWPGCNLICNATSSSWCYL